MTDDAPAPRFLDVPIPEETDWARDTWPPVIVRRSQLDAEIERLAGRPSGSGPRRAVIAHPRASVPAHGLAPGVEVALEVLLPGESTPRVRHSSSIISFCIRGGGTVSVDGHVREFTRFDTWNVPSMATYAHSNPTDEVQVRLTYSNAALLRALGVHWVDPVPPPDAPGDGAPLPKRDAPALRELGDGALLMGYEDLINPLPAPQPALLWPWQQVEAALQDLGGIDGSYNGRRLFLLYNPATGRTNGTSPAFFATITIRPPEIVDRPHRHAAAAINYFFKGSGWSRVAGRRYTWEAGDLMFTAPGWAIHHHASGPDPVYELTIQDFPLHLAMDSLMWQEDLKHPPKLLGSGGGFRTNRSPS